MRQKKEAVQSFGNALWSVSFPLIYGSGQLLWILPHFIFLFEKFQRVKQLGQDVTDGGKGAPSMLMIPSMIFYHCSFLWIGCLRPQEAPVETVLTAAVTAR